MEGKWLSILEYAAYKKKSISTVRRYVKAQRVKTREENGKYFIWTKGYIDNQSLNEKESLELKFENERLKKENKTLKEQLAEYQMLVRIYESTKDELPSLPGEL
ncbi:MAG: hypothetical protein N4A33_09085 [Bacteriovoracaceae bacterium]|jgi:cell shape-determining protein MreC|nr:hypothetical protein [Bacteriovoracaceae bacterium]